MRQGNERVLHYFLRGPEVADQEGREPYERTVMGAVQLRDCLVDIHGPVRTRANRDGHPGHGHQGLGHVSWTRSPVHWLTRGHSRILRQGLASPRFHSTPTPPTHPPAMRERAGKASP